MDEMDALTLTLALTLALALALLQTDHQPAAGPDGRERSKQSTPNVNHPL